MNREIDSKTERLTQIESELNVEREMVRQLEMESEQLTIGFLVDLLGTCFVMIQINHLIYSINHYYCNMLVLSIEANHCDL